MVKLGSDFFNQWDDNQLWGATCFIIKNWDVPQYNLQIFVEFSAPGTLEDWRQRRVMDPTGFYRIRWTLLLSVLQLLLQWRSSLVFDHSQSPFKTLVCQEPYHGWRRLMRTSEEQKPTSVLTRRIKITFYIPHIELHKTRKMAQLLFFPFHPTNNLFPSTIYHTVNCNNKRYNLSCNKQIFVRLLEDSEEKRTWCKNIAAVGRG